MKYNKKEGWHLVTTNKEEAKFCLYKIEKGEVTLACLSEEAIKLPREEQIFPKLLKRQVICDDRLSRKFLNKFIKGITKLVIKKLKEGEE